MVEGADGDDMKGPCASFGEGSALLEEGGHRGHDLVVEGVNPAGGFEQGVVSQVPTHHQGRGYQPKRAETQQPPQQWA